MFERFTDRSRRVLVLAQEEARMMDHRHIGTEHLLVGLVHEGDGVAAKTLGALGVSLEAVRDKVQQMREEAIEGPDMAPGGSPPFTPRAKKVLELSLREALQLGHSYIGTEHLLLGLVREEESEAVRVLTGLGVDLPQVRAHLFQIMSGHQGPGGESRSPGEMLRRSTTATALEPAEAKFVSCSFCGRQPPESGRLVSGTEAFICEHCIGQWARQLGRSGVADPILRRGMTQRRGTVRPTGPPPEDQDAARTAITAAFTGRWLSEDGQSVPMVERGENLGPTLSLARQHMVPEAAEVVVSIDDIVFIDSEHAAVWFTLSWNGSPKLRRHQGAAVALDGSWKMAHSTFCNLMALAGVPCPPEYEIRA